MFDLHCKKKQCKIQIISFENIMNIKQDLNVRTSAAETDIFQFPSTGWVDRRNSLLITPIMERHFFFIKVLTVYFLLVSESFLTSTPLPPPPPPSTHPSSLTVVMGWDTNILQVSPLTVTCTRTLAQLFTAVLHWYRKAGQGSSPGKPDFFLQLHKLCLDLRWSTLHAILILLQQTLCFRTKITLYLSFQ